MSFKLGLNRVQELMVIALMLVLIFALYSNIDLAYKIVIGAMVFTIILLTSVAAEALKEIEERNKQKL